MIDNIKLIGLDLDGTLLHNDKHISDYTRDTIAKAVNQGVVVLPATGRPVNGIPKEVFTIPGIRYALGSNGASIIDIKTGEELYSCRIPLEETLKLIDLLLPLPVIIEVYQDGNGYTERASLAESLERLKGTPIYEYVKSTRVPVNHLRDFIASSQKPAEKLNLIIRDASHRPKIREALSAFSFITVTSSVTDNLEINDRRADKGSSLLALGRILGIRQQEIMAFGDSENDYAMIKAAGFGVAMGNAADEIKRIARYITGTNEEDGVAAAIERFVLKP